MTDESKKKRPTTPQGLVIKAFSIEDVENREPAIYEKIYRFFATMQIKDNQKLCQELISDYWKWFEAKDEEFKAKQAIEKAKAVDRAKADLAKYGIDLDSALGGETA